MKNVLFLFIAFSGIVLSRQLPHPLSVGRTNDVSASNDTVNILAIMVQFQTDNDIRTSGSGQFDLGAAAVPIIDAPPHDSAYFADHFIFAKNYFRKASNGKQHVNAVVLGRVITLPKQMREYAPIDGYLPLARMIEEAWQKADSFNPGFPFHTFDLFMVFHAGVGKDIDLRGALGYDPTPFDLPSLYFSFNGLKNIFGPSFTGIPMQNSSFAITNTVILPETEVRSIPSIGEDIVLKLSMNGLLVASIASHLGLPDLFDTKTGRTAIGRFGLMDGQSIFSYSGIAPPEPSAWEKIRMGWTVPIDVYGTTTLSAPAVGLHETGNDTVYRIPISAKEYFLVENRQRDARQNGQTVTMKWNGQIITKTFMRDEIFFSNTNIDSVYGVVLDVDELDWSLPGLINDNNDYRGGILVWHIDETIIEKNLASNSINADPSNRGIDVEEADGSQDIGQSYDLLSPGSGSEDGSPLDYWFSGNIAPVYKNEFSEKTKPNSLTNKFARSHVAVKNFSVSSPRMSFDAQIGSAEIRLAAVIRSLNPKGNNDDAPVAVDLDGNGTEEIVYVSGDSIYALKEDLTPYLNNSTGLFYPRGGAFQPAFVRSAIPGNPFARGLAGVSDSSIYLITPFDSNNDGMADIHRIMNVGDRISTPVTVKDNLPFGQYLVGTEHGHAIVADTVAVATSLFSSPIISTSTQATATGDSIYVQGSYIRIDGGIRSVAAANATLIIVHSNRISLYNIPSRTLIKQIILPGMPTTPLALHDINGDNSADLIIAVGNELYVYNISGSVAENFPYTISDRDAITGGLVISDSKIVFGTANGLIHAVTPRGRIVEGFPLQSGRMHSAPFIGSKYLLAFTGDSSISIWRHASVFSTANDRWRTYLGTSDHNAGLNLPGSTVLKSNEMLPKKFAYNWPNPAYGSSTNIRYFLGKSAAVRIKIVTMAGELVDEFAGPNDVGMDNEVLWNISNVQSGIYYAHITASGSNGEQMQVIKIAVVK
jgi:hypothetical protein